MQPNNQCFEWLVFLPSVIIVIGWIVINYQNSYRDTRKEIRTCIDKIQSELEILEKSAVDYHTAEPHPNDGRFIKVRIDRLGKQIQALSSTLCANYSYHVFRLRYAITIENFDTEEHRILPNDDPVMDKIAESVDEVIAKLDDSYRDKYQISQLEKWKCKQGQNKK